MKEEKNEASFDIYKIIFLISFVIFENIFACLFTAYLNRGAAKKRNKEKKASHAAQNYFPLKEPSHFEILELFIRFVCLSSSAVAC